MSVRNNVLCVWERSNFRYWAIFFICNNANSNTKCIFFGSIPQIISFLANILDIPTSSLGRIYNGRYFSYIDFEYERLSDYGLCYRVLYVIKILRHNCPQFLSMQILQKVTNLILTLIPNYNYCYTHLCQNTCFLLTQTTIDSLSGENKTALFYSQC